jgi:hypothetical protein
MSLKKLYPELTREQRAQFVEDLMAALARDGALVWVDVPHIGTDQLGDTDSKQLSGAVIYWDSMTPDERTSLLNDFVDYRRATALFEKQFQTITARAREAVHENSKLFVPGVYFKYPKTGDTEWRVVECDLWEVVAVRTSPDTNPPLGNKLRLSNVELMQATILLQTEPLAAEDHDFDFSQFKPDVRFSFKKKPDPQRDSIWTVTGGYTEGYGVTADSPNPPMCKGLARVGVHFPPKDLLKAFIITPQSRKAKARARAKIG